MNLCLSGPYHLPASHHPIESCVILLHGRGSNGKNLMNLGLSWASHFPKTAFFAPNGLLPYIMEEEALPESYEWFSFCAGDWALSESNLHKALPVLRKFIQQVQTMTNVPSDKIILSGFSQGSALALSYGLYERPLVGGVLGYSGAFFGARPLPGDPYPPLTLIHGTQDSMVPLQYHKNACHFLSQNAIPYKEFTLSDLSHGINSRGIEIGQAFLKKTLGNQE